jgi:surface polysaccharide O-acyltransferase-like enzyme
MSARLLRAVWLVAAAAVAGAAIAAIVTIVSGEPGSEGDAKTIFSLAAVFLCGGAAVGALFLLDRPGLRALGVLALTAAVVDFALLELGIWKAVFFDGESSDYVKLIPTGFAWAIAILILATLPLVASAWRLLLLTAVPAVGACALVAATLATVMIWRELDSTGWLKTLAVLVIVTFAGYLLTPLIERLTRLETTPAPPDTAGV